MIYISRKELDNAAELHRAHEIHNDFFISFATLERDRSKLKLMETQNNYPSYELQRITETTLNTLRVFNQNCRQILEKLTHPGKKLSPSESAGLEAYFEANPHLSEEQAALNFHKEKATEILATHDPMHEEKLLRQLCVAAESLETRIKKTITKLRASFQQQKQIETVSWFGLENRSLEHELKLMDTTALRQHGIFELVLRPVTPLEQAPKMIIESVVSQQQTPATPSSPKVDVNSHSQVDDLNSRPATVAVSEQLAPAATPSSVKVTINYNVGFGKTLGICCEPNWDKEPISLSNMGNDWSGEVPAGKNWKFVILKNSQVFRWEERREDRRCEAKADAPTLNCTGLVKFS